MRPPFEEPCQELKTPIPGAVRTVSQAGSKVGLVVPGADAFLLVVIEDPPIHHEQEID